MSGSRGKHEKLRWIQVASGLQEERQNNVPLTILWIK